MNKALHFSSKKSDWETPQDFFDKYDAIYHFTLDVCASKKNAKCARYFDKRTDGLKQTWAPEVCWMNPPYGRGIEKWLAKAAYEAERGATVVCLLPARTDTRWFHDFVIPFGKVEFIRGRLKFVGAKHPAPFPSAVVVFGGKP